MQWAFVPRRFMGDPIADAATLFSSMFMHAGWLHLGGNMLYLWIFGDNVEDRFGHITFLIFYLLCGLAATGAQLSFSLGSGVPNLGASGRLPVCSAPTFDVPTGMGPGPAVFTNHANARLDRHRLWFALQLFSSIGSIANTAQSGGGGVAYMAHVGGFVAGLVLGFCSVAAAGPSARDSTQRPLCTFSDPEVAGHRGDPRHGAHSRRGGAGCLR